MAVNEQVADGLVIIGEDFRLLGHLTKLEIYKEVRVEPLAANFFKGTVDFVKKRVVKINLSKNTDPQIALLVTPSHQIKDIRMDDDIIKESFVCARKDALDSLDAGGKTIRDIDKETTCIQIQPRDVQAFANRLMEAMKGHMMQKKTARLRGTVFAGQDDFAAREQIKERMQVEGYNYKCFFAIYEIGQSEDYKDYMRKLKSKGFQPQFAKEVILHVARDYVKPGKCLLWELDKLLPNQGILMEGWCEVFSNLMTYGHGNVTFDKTTKKGSFNKAYLAIHDSGMHYAHLKFYTDSFKQTHRDKLTGVRKWKAPTVETALTNVDYAIASRRHVPQHLVKPQTVKGWIEEAFEYVEKLKRATQNVARFEAIIVIPQRELVGKTPKSIWASFGEFFKRILGAEKVEEGWLAEFDYGKLTDQVDNTIMVVLRQLQRIVDKVLEKRQNEMNILASVPALDTLQTALVCEQIIAFCIYGKINFYNSQQTEKYHPSELKKALHLDPKFYRHLPTDGSPFHGLDGCGEKLEVSHGRVIWKGQTHLSRNAWGDLIRDVGQNEMENLREYLLEMRKGLSDAAIYFPDICRIFWIAVNKFAEEEPVTTEIPEYVQTCKHCRFVFDTSLAFFEKVIAQPQEFFQRGFVHFIRDLKEVLGHQWTELKKQLVLHFEQELYKMEKLYILYPIRRRVNYFVILPYFGSEENNYRNASAERQQTVRSLYKLAFEHQLSRDYFNRDILNLALLQLDGARREFAAGGENYFSLYCILNLVAQGSSMLG